MKYAQYVRRLQFEAGPQTHEFYACEQHRSDLEAGDVLCFYGVKSEPVRAVSLDDEWPCDLCREGGSE